MAKGIRQPVNLAKGLRNFESVEYGEMIDELIRLDIPILLVGASSIGKSYTLTQNVKKYGIEHEFLFIGSEKAEYIEGIPDLKRQDLADLSPEEKSKLSKEELKKFAYLKPFWFPKAGEIRRRLLKGREEFKKQNEKLYSSLYSYEALKTYKEMLMKVDVVKANRDQLLYISMLQGYGNFWLILDEIDKVEEYDKDKFAPMLHIVRERMLKGWALRGVATNNEYKHIQSINKRQQVIDFAIDLKDADGNPLKDDKGNLITDMSYDNITDTRIIAIANYSKNITEDALVKRFVHFRVDKTLYEDRELPKGKHSEKELMKYAEELRRKGIHKCVASKPFKGMTVQQSMATIDETNLVDKLPDANLQWTLGFLPDLLFPIYPEGTLSEEMIPNAFVEDYHLNENMSGFIGKIISDNFENEIGNILGECIQDQLEVRETFEKDAIYEGAVKLLSKIPVSDYNNPDGYEVSQIFQQYENTGELYIKDIEKNVKEQTDKSIKAGSEGSGATEQTYAKLIDWSRRGFRAIELSVQDKMPTKLTSILISGLPLLMKKVLGGSSFVSYDEYQSFLKRETEFGRKIIVDNASIKLNPDMEDNFFATEGKKFFDKLGKYDVGYIDMYGYGLDSMGDDSEPIFDKMKEFEAMEYQTSDEGLALMKEILLKSAKNNPVLIHPAIVEYAMEIPDEVRAFVRSTVPYIVMMKEVSSNLPRIFKEIFITSGIKTMNALKDYGDYDKVLKYYVDNFPYRSEKLLTQIPAFKKLSYYDDLMLYMQPMIDSAKAYNQYMAFDKEFNS